MNHASVDTLQAQGTVKIASEQGDIAKRVIHIEQALRVMVGNDPHTAQHWMHCHNHHIDGIPVELVSQAEGLARVLAYLQMVNRSS